MKNIRNFLITTFLLIGTHTAAFAQTTVTPCPTSNQTADCISNNLGFNLIDLRRFFPNLPFNDLVSSVSTIILVGLVIFFGFRIILAGLKFVNNDGQDKSKKDAIKSISSGAIGILITFSAYFIVLFVRSFTAGGDNLVNCATLFYGNSYDTYHQNSAAPNLAGTTSEFNKCIILSGKDGQLNVGNTYEKFASQMTDDRVCAKYISKLDNFTFQINDADSLRKCFVNVINNL